MNEIKIISPGLFTTVQDLGRFGYQKYGMPQSGAMDAFSLQLANILVGNSSDEACLEITFSGPEMEMDCDAVIAITGAHISPFLNGTPIQNNIAIQVTKGNRLQFGTLKSGFRAYLAIATGFIIPTVMESKSTYIKAKIGGIPGRALKAGDVLEIGNIKTIKPIYSQVDAPKWINKSVYEIDVIPGPEAKQFSFEGIQTFLNSTFQISSASDRMGYRLDGPTLGKKTEIELLSSGIALGTIQVPTDGMPIILLSERQTTGGYPRIANVISADIPILAQLKPGDNISFNEVSMNVAVTKLEEKKHFLNQLIETRKR